MDNLNKQASPVLSAIVLVWGVVIAVLIVIFYINAMDGISSISVRAESQGVELGQ